MTSGRGRAPRATRGAPGRGAAVPRARPAQTPEGPRSPRPLAVVAGATGFVGRALVPALVAAGWRVRATTRRLARGAPAAEGVEWVEADLTRPPTVAAALAGAQAAFHLVHGMASARDDWDERERLGAAILSREAARAGVERIVYLGGVAPRGPPSRHLASRLAVGEVLRAGRVPAVELRASMIVGAGSASWRVVRDLALRLPAVVLPSWAGSRTRPVAIDDVVRALVAALRLPVDGGAWLDLPGPDVLGLGEMLARVAALRGRRLPALPFPLPAPRLSSAWLKLVSDADWRVVRELVQGLGDDLLPSDDRFWTLTAHGPLVPFDEAARRALADDAGATGLRGLVAGAEEALVELLGPRLA